MGNTHLFTSIVLLAVSLGLTGCETKPEDIETWKTTGDTKKLVGALNNSEQFIRIKAIDALVELKVAEATPALAALFTDADQVIVHKSIHAAAAIGDPSLEPFILPVLGFETAEARMVAAKSLGNLKSKQAVQPLCHTLNDEFSEVVAAAAEALGKIGDPAAIPALSEKTSDSTFSIRFGAVHSIAQIGGKEAVPVLAFAMGDFSEKVRTVAVAGLAEQPETASFYVRKSLRSPNKLERESALLFLEKKGIIPTSGTDLFWYRLASLTVDEKVPVDPAKAAELARIEGAVEGLLEAVTFEERAVREYAGLALELIGERVAPNVAALAEQSTAGEANAWFNLRSGWAGAPDWKIDLWGGVIALNPAFEINKRGQHLLENGGVEMESMLASEAFTAEPEMIPQLISLFRTTESEDIKDIKFDEKCRKLTMVKLKKAGSPVVLPLLAALNDADLSIAAYAAKMLVQIGDPRAEQAIIEAFAQRLENGDQFAGTPFYDAMLELDAAEAKELVKKVRPNTEMAIRTAEENYSGIKFTNVPLQFDVDPEKQAAPFRLVYLKDGKAKELKTIFRPDENGNWIPMPPLPDEL